MTPTLDSFVDALKVQIATPKADLEKNIRALLNELISKYDLASQQELARLETALKQSNQRLDVLKTQLDALEESLDKT